MEAPILNVGIMKEKAISFVLHNEYLCRETGDFLSGEQRVLLVKGDIVFEGKCYKKMSFIPTDKEAYFELKAVTIGIDFHWQRKENQSFRGSLTLLSKGDGIQVINSIDIEDYLASVISSEMNKNASKEFLKAHTVISRSWLMAQIEKKHTVAEADNKYESFQKDIDRIIKWYDREDHLDFDVCADDHCQRYQGVSKVVSSEVEAIVKETRGEILYYEDKICDARFSKCCGGVTEEFEHCWESVHHSYLAAVRDNENSTIPDLTIETEAEKWIKSSPESFCNTKDSKILKQVLNNYDQETKDFYRWKVKFSQTQLSELIWRKSGIDFGEIRDLIPLKRGKSGRIEELKVVGTLKTFTIGKELEIRRILSESHLYSSAFVVEKEDIVADVPKRFVLYGAGWGHGVGLCQIGAAVMGSRGYNYEEILSHYFTGASLLKRY